MAMDGAPTRDSGAVTYMTADDMRNLFLAAYVDADSELRSRFKRSLPLGDAFIDRWERAKTLGFADGASIYGSAIVFGTVRVGRNTWIGPNTLLDGSADALEIGSNCSISAGTQIYTHDTVLWAVSGGRQPKRHGSVKIGDNVYVGSQCVIVPSIAIGSQAVIGANSLVNRSVPERTIVAGSPARQIGTVEVLPDGTCTLSFNNHSRGEGDET